MSSDVQDALAEQQTNDYGSLVILAAITYDYCLTSQKEVTYIWKKPRTWVSILFLLIRYAGLVSVLTSVLYGTTFMPGLTKVVSVSSLVSDTANANASIEIETESGCLKGTMAYLLGNWAYPIFWMGADAVMILRVYAMYNRSKLVLFPLLFMYVAEMGILFAESAIYSDQNYASVSTAQLFDITVCNLVYNTQTWNNAATYAQFALAIVMCILVAAQYARHSYQMYRAWRTWQPNKYISLLVRDSLLYFLVTLLYTLLNLLGLMNLIPPGWTTRALVAVADIPLYTLTPRFVLNVRELYACDVEGQEGCDIDTGFGLSMVRSARGLTSIGTMAFAEGGEIAGLDDAGENQEIALVENTREQETNPLAGLSYAHAGEPLIAHR